VGKICPTVCPTDWKKFEKVLRRDIKGKESFTQKTIYLPETLERQRSHETTTFVKQHSQGKYAMG
jgi:hypothetical protein